MTDNEKRAHDLTMLYVQEVSRLKISSAKPSVNGEPSTSLDFLQDYIDLYPQILDKINEKFS